MRFGNRNPFFAAIFVAALTIIPPAILASAISIRPAIMIFSGEGRKLASIPVMEEGFVHRYIHSIHKTPVDEEFVISGDTLELVRVRYDTYGVGMPSDGGDAFRIEDNRFVVDMHRSFKKLDIRVSHLPGHGIVYDGSFHPFTEWATVESSITLKAGVKVLIFSRRKAHP